MLNVVDDIDIADPGPGEVRVRASHCGVCHSDLGIVDGTFPNFGTIVLGHEAAGIVDAVGAGVTALQPDDKVVLTPIAACDECYWCLRGEYGCCVNAMAVTTGTALDGHTPLSRNGAPVLRGLGVGGFAEMVVTPASGAVKVADDTPLEIACVIGCAVQTGVGAVLNTASVEPGATLLVVGAGGVGIAIAGARIAGAARIIVSDPVAGRRDAARRFGATDVIDPTVKMSSPCARAHERDRCRLRARCRRLRPADRGLPHGDANGGTTVMVGAADRPAVALTRPCSS